MLNKEEYMNELLEFACTDNKFAITKDGKLRECRGVRCNECALESDGMDSCDDLRRKWMEQEYKEPHVDWVFSTNKSGFGGRNQQNLGAGKRMDSSK